jgi:hypothetical protein
MDRDELRVETSQPASGRRTSAWTALLLSLRGKLQRYFPILFRQLRGKTGPTYRKLAQVPAQCPKCGAKPPPPLELFSFGALLKVAQAGWHVELEWYPFWPLHRWRARCMGPPEGRVSGDAKSAARRYVDHVAACLRTRDSGTR